MNHRHLLPSEIDLLLDEEVGFGIAPLKAHVRECADCRARFEEGTAVFAELDELQHFAPSARFAGRIMEQVPVFVPWHVAARDTLAQLTPRSRPARALALAALSGAGVVLTTLVIWITSNVETVTFAAALFGARARTDAAGALQQFGLSLFGEQAFAALARAGFLGMALGAGSLAVVLSAVLLGMRQLTAGAARRRT